MLPCGKGCQSHRSIKSSAAKNSTEPSQKPKRENKHYCSEHGYNPTHITGDCYALKNRAKATNHAPKADKTNCLHGELKETIYMEIPKGLQANENKCLLLNKTIYSLVQSAREFYNKLVSAL
jgi:hypothetical protein